MFILIMTPKTNLNSVLDNISTKKNQSQVHISKEYLQLEPIGLVFVFFFALILVIQFTAMLFHRFGTLSHILASTELNFCCNKKAEELSQDALIDKVCAHRKRQHLFEVESKFCRSISSMPSKL